MGAKGNVTKHRKLLISDDHNCILRIQLTLKKGPPGGTVVTQLAEGTSMLDKITPTEPS